MNAIQHSGNACSGMCRPPCGHEGCWQCDEGLDKTAARDLLQKAKSTLGMKQERPKGLLSQMRPSDPKDGQTTTITRSVLEGLCEKAGVTLIWGDPPTFRDDGDMMRAAALKEEERKRLQQEKVKELERITQAQSSGSLSAQAARTLAENAVKTIDAQVAQVLQAGTADVIRADAEKREADVIADLKAKGATDADIEAARSLLGGVVSEPKPSKVDPDHAPALLTVEQLKATVAKLGASGVDLTTTVGIVHPDFARQLEAELQSVSGLNDLLLGTAPSQVLASGSAIKAQIESYGSRIGWKAMFAGVEL